MFPDDETADLDPNAVTLAGDSAARQAAFQKLAGEMYRNVVQKTAQRRSASGVS